MAATLAEQDKVRARHHLGYLNVEQAQTFVLGIPAGVQTQFMIEGALNRLLPQALPKFLEMLERLDCVECELFGGIDLASITSISDIVIRPERRKELSGYYQVARQGLANLLGIIPNPYDQRTWIDDGMINVPVING
jgi:hypothetical protein